MTKMEYLKQLESGLRDKLTEQEIYDIMRDYAEYFEEGKTGGKTEQDIINSLGTPQYVVSQILEEQDNPEMYEEKEESDDIIGAAKVKFKRIRARMEENKRYNERKKRERASEKQKMEYRANENSNREREHGYREYRDNKYREPRYTRQRGASGCLTGLLLAILWVFVIVPVLMFLLTTGGGFIFGGISAIVAVSAFSPILVPISSVAGIFTSITVLLAGITILLLGVIFLRFCIKKTFNNVKEPQEEYLGNNDNKEDNNQSFASKEQQEENDEDEKEEGEEYNA